MSNYINASNRYGQVYDYPKECITQLTQINPGDHMAYANFGVYWHHFIIEHVDVWNQMIHVIHYYNDLSGGTINKLTVCSKATVRRDRFVFQPNRYYRIVYNSTTPYPPEIVIQRARVRLGEERFNIATNNCENFAKECKIGSSHGQQLWTGVTHGLFNFLGTLLRLLVDLGLCDDAKEIEKVIMEGGFSELPTAAGRCSTKSGVLVLILTELAFLLKDLYEARNKMENGWLLKQQFKDLVVKRVISAFISVISAVAVPLVAAWFGVATGGWLMLLFGVVGSTVGRYVGSFLNSYVIEVVNYMNNLIKNE